jgi:hypothetical protein
MTCTDASPAELSMRRRWPHSRRRAEPSPRVQCFQRRPTVWILLDSWQDLVVLLGASSARCMVICFILFVSGLCYSCVFTPALWCLGHKTTLLFLLFVQFWYSFDCKDAQNVESKGYSIDSIPIVDQEAVTDLVTFDCISIISKYHNPQEDNRK